jgi:hypothetical protein
MKKLLYGAFIGAVALSLGCAVTNYPVIFDSRGAYDNAVLDGQYDQAYIIPTSSVATLWDDGSDELYTLVAQNWTGDQWLKTYNNFDASGAINFLDQTYCDPTRQSNCALATSWNPDLPDAYPHGSTNAPYNTVDNVFDYELDASCSGARSLSLLLSMSSRVGECGSGIYANLQNAMGEFASAERVTWNGKTFYAFPISNASSALAITAQDGTQLNPSIPGVFNLLVNDKFQSLLQVGGNARYALRTLAQINAAHGSYLDVSFTYNSLVTNFKVNVEAAGLQGALDRM